tara:strand:+ start:534 stop:1874 length:1341 start_codon:yes stop_codon:yes gene_type:complete
MASWKKVVVSGSAADLASLTLDTKLAVAEGGTGVGTFTNGGILLGSGTGAITATAVLGNGVMIVGDGSGDPVLESGATLRTSIGVDVAGTDNSTAVTLNANITDVLTLSTQAISATDPGNADILAGWDHSANKFTYLTAADVKTALSINTGATASVSPFAATLLDDAAASNMRSTLGLGSAALENVSAFATESITAFAALLLDDANASTMQSTLGLAGGALLGTAAVTNGASTLATGDQIYDHVTTRLMQVTGSGGTITTGGNGLSVSGATMNFDLKANGGLVIESNKGAVDLGASSLTGTLGLGDGGTGQTTAAAAASALLNTSQGGALTVGDGSDTITIPGNLTVSGTQTILDVTNLAIDDQFININASGSAADAGIFFHGQGASLGWDESAHRLAFDFEGGGQYQTTIASDAFVAMVVTGSNASYQYNGNIKIDSSEIYIYVE